MLAVVIEVGLVMSPVFGPVHAYVTGPCPPVAVVVMVTAAPTHVGLGPSTTGIFGILFTVSVGVTVNILAQPGADAVRVYIAWSPMTVAVMLVEPLVAVGFTFALTPPVHAYVNAPAPPVITAPMLTGVPAHTVVAFRLGTIDAGIWFTVNVGVTVNTLAQLATLAVSV